MDTVTRNLDPRRAELEMLGYAVPADASGDYLDGALAAARETRREPEAYARRLAEQIAERRALDGRPVDLVLIARLARELTALWRGPRPTSSHARRRARIAARAAARAADPRRSQAPPAIEVEDRSGALRPAIVALVGEDGEIHSVPLLVSPSATREQMVEQARRIVLGEIVGPS
jgi:hypothetical protein